MATPVITNPVLPGFHPDPSFVRVGDDYYLATSTFEWFPGVQLHHSRDLVHWRTLGHALTRTSQLDLRGIADSAGVWAPSLSYADGKFWLIYTNIRNTGMGRPFKDIGIYLTTAESIEGPWSDPVTLDSIGFDPSLFHDDDGRKYLLNMRWDFRKGRYRFAGIVLQEYDPVSETLVGPRSEILVKENILTEGPNLYKRDGWYYLMLAEGGTGWNHGISMARSRNLLGPYELDPQPSVLTTRDDESQPLQKAGHGELVQTQSGEWYLAHLASRPLGQGVDRRCILGRETCLQKVTWSEDGWLRLAHGGHHPLVEVPAPPELPATPWPAVPAREDFADPALGPEWSALRRPITDDWASLSARPGWLRLKGGDSLHSWFHQSLVARRLESTRCRITTRLDFSPDHHTQMAGLVCYYDTRSHYYLRVTADDHGRRILGLVLTDDATYDEPGDDLDVSDWPPVWLRAEIHDSALQFSASPDGETWVKIGKILDATKLSDDYGNYLHFTGAFAGLCVQDLGGTHRTADFDFFEMTPL
ncbi:glycoside hydrolase family 43 protein [Luteolibacter sp. LG18]|uniref:glycoside hydrolase family 43 protein n=1 Tax=Luteolibacter sp. LG18 TaxID=2819286 RepID=UPI0030C69990